MSLEGWSCLVMRDGKGGECEVNCGWVTLGRCSTQYDESYLSGDYICGYSMAYTLYAELREPCLNNHPGSDQIPPLTSYDQSPDEQQTDPFLAAYTDVQNWKNDSLPTLLNQTNANPVN